MKKLFTSTVFSLLSLAASSSFAQIVDIRDCDRYVVSSERASCLTMYSRSVASLVNSQVEEIVTRPSVYGSAVSNQVRQEAPGLFQEAKQECNYEPECLYYEYIHLYKRYDPLIQKARRDTHERLAKKRSARDLLSIPAASSDDEYGE